MPLTWPASLARRTKSGCDRRVVVNAQQARARPTTRICGEETMVASALWRRCPAALAASIALLMAAIASVPAAEQDRFPQRPIRLIVPFTAGGAYDVVARLVAEAMSKNLGGSIVVENRPGAGGNFGAQAVATAPPDGDTLLLRGLPMLTSMLTNADV